MSVLTKKQIEILAKSKRAVVGYDPDKPIGESELFTEDILDTIADLQRQAQVREIEIRDAAFDIQFVINRLRAKQQADLRG